MINMLTQSISFSGDAEPNEQGRHERHVCRRLFLGRRVSTGVALTGDQWHIGSVAY